MSDRPSLPRAVARQLRQEAGFGCAICGNPILDYHHIVPWEEREHYEAENMVAVCPNHHRELAACNRDVAYAAKRNPRNIKLGLFKGALLSKESQPEFMAGGVIFEDVRDVLSYRGFPIIQYSVESGRGLLNLYIPDAEFWPELQVVDNDLRCNVSSFWDIEYRPSYACFRRKSGEKSVEIDFRTDVVKFAAKLEIFGEDVSFLPEKTKVGTNTISGMRIKRCLAAIAVGPSNEKIFPPNYAMVEPRALLVRH